MGKRSWQDIQRLSDDEVAKIRAVFLEVRTVAETARRTGRHQVTVRKYVHDPAFQAELTKVKEDEAVKGMRKIVQRVTRQATERAVKTAEIIRNDTEELLLGHTTIAKTLVNHHMDMHRRIVRLQNEALSLPEGSSERGLKEAELLSLQASLYRLAGGAATVRSAVELRHTLLNSYAPNYQEFKAIVARLFELPGQMVDPRDRDHLARELHAIFGEYAAVQRERMETVRDDDHS